MHVCPCASVVHACPPHVHVPCTEPRGHGQVVECTHTYPSCTNVHTQACPLHVYVSCVQSHAEMHTQALNVCPSASARGQWCMHAHCTWTHHVHSHMHACTPLRLCSQPGCHPQQHTLQEDNDPLCARPSSGISSLKQLQPSTGCELLGHGDLPLVGTDVGMCGRTKPSKKKKTKTKISQIAARVWLCCQTQVLLSDRGENLLSFVCLLVLFCFVLFSPGRTGTPEGDNGCVCYEVGLAIGLQLLM